MSDAIPESLVARIRKLLALANDTRGNENEAAAASAKVQALLAEYNLEMSQVLNDGGAANPDAARVTERSEDFAREEWQGNLMQRIAENNFCLHWIETRDEALWARPVRRHMLIGRQVNVVTTRDLYDYLVATMDRLNPFERRTKSHRSWTEGCVSRIGSRLYRQRQDSLAASRASDAPRGNGTDLVLADVYSSEDDLNNDARYGYEAGTTARRRAEHEREMAEYRERAKNQPVPAARPQAEETAAERRRRLAREEALNRKWQRQYERQSQKRADRIDHAAYDLGREAGDEIGLDKQIEGAAERARRLH